MSWDCTMILQAPSISFGAPQSDAGRASTQSAKSFTRWSIWIHLDPFDRSEQLLDVKKTLCFTRMCQFEQVQLEDCQGTGYSQQFTSWSVIVFGGWTRLGLCRSDSRHRTIPAPSCARVSTSGEKFRQAQKFHEFSTVFFKLYMIFHHLKSIWTKEEFHFLSYTVEALICKLPVVPHEAVAEVSRRGKL